METKVCSKCKTEKPLNEYYKNSSSPDGRRGSCITCKKQWNKDNAKKINTNARKFYRENKELISSRVKDYYEKNKEQKLDYQKKYVSENEEKVKEKNKEYREKNKDKLKEYTQRWYKDNADKRKAYREENKDRQREWARLYQKKNRVKINKWYVEKRKNDPLAKLRHNMRSLVYHAFYDNGYSKKTKSAKIIGCSFKELKKHLESQFLNNMSWENYGDWHVDHILPLNSAKNENEIIALNHFKNLQPMWGKENQSKGDKYDPKDKEKYLEWYSENVIKK